MGKTSWYTYKLIIFSGLGSITYGYSSGITGSITGQPRFLEYFDYEKGNGSRADIFNGIFLAAAFFGTLFGGHLSEKLGRRISIFTSCCISVVGGAVMCGSVTIGMLYVARIIMGFGTGMLVLLIPLWQTEISPANSRGLLVGLHGVMILTGYSSSAWINVGFYFLSDSSAQWRGPLAIQVLWPILLGSGIWIMPESPRWLIEHGKPEFARKVFQMFEPDFTEEKFTTLVEAMEKEDVNTSWMSLFTHKPYMKRSFVGIMTMFGAMGTGTLAVSFYGPTLYAQLGFDNMQQLYLTAGYLTLGLVGNIVNAVLLDIVGRKKLLLFGVAASGIMVMTLESILQALYVGEDNVAGKRAASAVIYMHILFYASTVDASTYVYTSEIWPTHIRSKGAAISICTMFLGALAFTTGLTTALKTIKWKYLVVFICLSVVNVVIFYYYFPETKGIALEEIGTLFGDDPIVREVTSEESSQNGYDLGKTPTEVCIKALDEEV